MHGLDRLPHDDPRTLGLGLGPAGRLRGFRGAGRRAADGGGDLVEGRGRLLQGGGLLLGAAGHIADRDHDLFGAAHQAGGGVGDARQGGPEVGDRVVEIVFDLGVAALEPGLDLGGEVALRQPVERRGHGLHDALLVALQSLAPGVGRQAFLLGGGNVGGDLDHPGRPAGLVEDGVVGGLDPHLAPALGQATELLGGEFAAVQRAPEGGVLLAGRVLRIDEHRMLAADDLRQGVAHGVAEVVVGLDDGSVRAEFDDRLRAGDRLELAIEF